MRYLKRIPESIAAKSYFSKKAGSFSGTPQSTVQLWTEKGLITPEVSDTTGTGKRRLYSPLNVIEIGIIRELSDRRISHKAIAEVMSFLHRYEETLRVNVAGGITYEHSRVGSEISNLQKLLNAERALVFILFHKDNQIEIKGRGMSYGEIWVGGVDADGIEMGADVQTRVWDFIPQLDIENYDVDDLENAILFITDSFCVSSSIVDINTIAEDLINQME